MEKVYYDGREQARNKGKILFGVITDNNSKMFVKEKLLNVVENGNVNLWGRLIVI